MATRKAGSPKATTRKAVADDGLSRSIDAALQAYADRGVFRGFSVALGTRGTRQFRFTWLTRRPMLVTFGGRTRVLAFANLFPHVLDTPGVLGAIRDELRLRSTRAVPAHRRIDPRSAALTSVVREGSLSIRVACKGRDGRSVVRASLGLVNDVFLLLQERFPEYLVAHFGFKDE